MVSCSATSCLFVLWVQVLEHRLCNTNHQWQICPEWGDLHSSCGNLDCSLQSNACVKWHLTKIRIGIFLLYLLLTSRHCKGVEALVLYVLVCQIISCKESGKERVTYILEDFEFPLRTQELLQFEHCIADLHTAT